jgi:hypothetical protein
LLDIDFPKFYNGIDMSNSTVITIKPSPRQANRVLVELDVEKFERLAANLGLFRREFLESVERAEKDVAKGKVRRLRSLRDLRRPL